MNTARKEHGKECKQQLGAESESVEFGEFQVLIYSLFLTPNHQYLKSKIDLSASPIKGTKLLFVVIKSIIIICCDVLPSSVARAPTIL